MNDDGGADYRQAQELQEHQEWTEQYNQQEKRTMKWKDSGGGDFEQPPVGTHPARCIKIIDIGTQKGEYQGKANFKRQVIIGWELPTELMTEGDYAGKPFTTSKFYTASLSEKANLRKDLQNWRGREFTAEELAGFESKKILGAPCMLSLTTNDKGKVRVTGVMALPKAMKATLPEQINPSVYFSLEPDEFSMNDFEALSDGIRKMVALSPEYQQAIKPKGKGTGFEDMPDDLPWDGEPGPDVPF